MKSTIINKKFLMIGAAFLLILIAVGIIFSKINSNQPNVTEYLALNITAYLY